MGEKERVRDQKSMKYGRDVMRWTQIENPVNIWSLFHVLNHDMNKETKDDEKEIREIHL